MIDDAARQRFQATVRKFYRRQGRHDLPWRRPLADGTFDLYCILVSEVMLQQTQVVRVIPKYDAFLRRFPNAASLAAAPLGDVLRAWSGLGYNRRAKFLWQAAQQLAAQERAPASIEELAALPGVGANTAGAVLAYAHNRPAVFIETNIRSVYIHHFFADRTAVPDSAIRELVEATLDRRNPREWYWALMDYGSFLKQTAGNAARRSKHYSRQSAFQGSRRQLRGQVLRRLSAGPATETELDISDERLPGVLAELLSEGLIRHRSGRYSL